MANGYEIKKILDDIIRNTYENEVTPEKLRNMFYYRVVLENKISKTRHGFYRPKERCVTILNLYRSETQLVCVAIHELAHHVDYMFRGTSDHYKPFYVVFKRLLYTGLDMGLFTREDAFEMKTDAADSNKIKSMLLDYKPNPIEYKNDKKRIIVKNGFSIKEKLKEKEFRYNSISFSWEKVVEDYEVLEHMAFLNDLSCEYEVADASAMNFEAIGTLVVTGSCYDYKDKLKAHGFIWNSLQKRWQKKIKMTEIDDEMKAVKDLEDFLVIKLEKNRSTSFKA